MNQVILVGNITADPKIVALGSGRKKASFRIATHRKYTDKDGVKHKETTFTPLVAFGKDAETLEKWAKKGQAMEIRGRTHSWKPQGQEWDTLEVVVEEFSFMGQRKDAPPAAAPKEQEVGQNQGIDNDLDFFDNKA